MSPLTAHTFADRRGPRFLRIREPTPRQDVPAPSPLRLNRIDAGRISSPCRSAGRAAGSTPYAQRCALRRMLSRLRGERRASDETTHPQRRGGLDSSAANDGLLLPARPHLRAPGLLEKLPWQLWLRTGVL